MNSGSKSSQQYGSETDYANNNQILENQNILKKIYTCKILKPIKRKKNNQREEEESPPRL